MSTKWWKVKIKLPNGVQEFVFPADTMFLAKQMVETQFGKDSIFYGPIPATPVKEDTDGPVRASKKEASHYVYKNHHVIYKAKKQWSVYDHNPKQNNFSKPPVSSGHPTLKSALSSLGTLLSGLKEDGVAVPTNSAGGGNVAGIGVGKDGEPGVDNRKKKKKKSDKTNVVIADMLRRKIQGK